jgi:undecaprenyl pyrophosphate phosphatase UppP
MTAAVYHMSFFQAIVIGLVQGLTELFPISSLGHTVLVPSWFGGTWATLVRQESSAESPYLAFILGLHLATAIVLVGFYAKAWPHLTKGIYRSVVRRRVETGHLIPVCLRRSQAEFRPSAGSLNNLGVRGWVTATS